MREWKSKIDKTVKVVGLGKWKTEVERKRSQYM